MSCYRRFKEGLTTLSFILPSPGRDKHSVASHAFSLLVCVVEELAIADLTTSLLQTLADFQHQLLCKADFKCAKMLRSGKKNFLFFCKKIASFFFKDLLSDIYSKMLRSGKKKSRYLPLLFCEQKKNYRNISQIYIYSKMLRSGKKHVFFFFFK